METHSIIDSIRSKEYLDALVDAPIDPKTGLKIIDQAIYQIINTLYFQTVSVGGLKFRFSRTENYRPFVKREDSLDMVLYQEPYCHENEKKWKEYLEYVGNNLPIVRTRVCNIFFDSSDKVQSIVPYVDTCVVFKDPYENNYGEMTGYTLGYVTTPVIVAISNGGDLLFLRKYNKEFIEAMDQIFPQTCVGIARESTLPSSIKDRLVNLTLGESYIV